MRSMLKALALQTILSKLRNFDDDNDDNDDYDCYYFY